MATACFAVGQAFQPDSLNVRLESLNHWKSPLSFGKSEQGGLHPEVELLGVLDRSQNSHGPNSTLGE
jgi:hypothetical protein